MKVLLADDDRVFQLMLDRTLAKWGYQPIVVGDGEEAWRHLAAPDGPSIAILDWVMPLADGLEVCRRVRSGNLARYVYVILLTSKSSSDELKSGLEAGADDYLPKPVNSDELRLRLRAGCRVLESEGRYRHIAENASDGIVTLDEGNRIHFVNNAAAAIFGYPRAELMGLAIATLVPDLERHLHNTCLRVPGANDDAARVRSWNSVEITGKRQTGGNVVLDVSFSESLQVDQERVLTLMIRDVTERRRLEEERTQAQRLESIGQLAAGVAHEINTPIQYIGDNAKFLDQSFRDLAPFVDAHLRIEKALRNSPEPELAEELARVFEEADIDYLRVEVPKAIEQLSEGVEQVARIVRAMKEFSHRGRAEKTPVNLNHAIESTILISRNEWKYVADMTTGFDADLPPVPCVAGEINQVVLNLIVNAAHAIADVVKDSGKKGAIHVSTRHNEGWAEIRVRDSGTGIPEAIRSKVFDPFFTTKEVGKGTGQGLSIAHSVIVQKHSGRLTFDTQCGIGTTFLIQLPLEQPDIS